MARTLREVTYDIDGVVRQMAKLVIQQSDIDLELGRLDRRRAYLEQEKQEITGEKLESENEI